MAERGGWAAKATYTERKNKVDVNYRIAEKCQMCDFYQGNKCERVNGNISPEALCDMWQQGSSKGGEAVKIPKEGIHYRNMSKCDTCDYYLNRKCKKVEGGISPETVCDIWEIREFPTGGIDGEFYKGEYDKQVRRGLL